MVDILNGKIIRLCSELMKTSGRVIFGDYETDYIIGRRDINIIIREGKIMRRSIQSLDIPPPYEFYLLKICSRP